MTIHEHVSQQAAATGPASLTDLVLRGMDLFAAQVARIGDARWDRPTPCEDWTVAELVRHTADTADRVSAALRGETWEQSPSTAPAADRWTEASTELRERLAETPLDDRWPIPGDAPHAKYRFHGCDFVIHAWDLSVALGQEVELPAEWVAYLDGFFSGVPAEVLRRPRAFHDPVEPAPGDGPTRRLMAFLGRCPL